MPAHPGNCDAATKQANAAIATKRQNPRNYAPVSVTIVAKQAADPAGSIRFSVYGMNGEFLATWGDEADMWAACPSTLPSQAEATDAGTIPGPQPAPTTSGFLYLSEQYVTASSIPAAPKWPKAEAETFGPYGVLRVHPKSLVLTGIELNDGRLKESTWELLDPYIAEHGQAIVIDENPMGVRLSLKAFSQVGVKFPESVAATQSTRRRP
jgi:hypothetical protein